MSSTELIILGRAFGKRLRRVYETLKAEAQCEIRFQKDDTATLEDGVLGEHEFDKKAGHLIRLAPNFSELTVAHELCHGLMLRRGFPTIGRSGLSQAINRATGVFASTLEGSLGHQVLNRYLEEFGYQKELSQYYADFRMNSLSKLRVNPPLNINVPHNFTCLACGLRMFELLVADEMNKELEEALAVKAPNCLEITRGLSSKLIGIPINIEPVGLRRRYVATVQWLDEYINRKSGIQSNLVREILVDPVLSFAEKQMPLKQLFQLEFAQSDVYDVAVVAKYKPDGGYCYAFLMTGREAERLERSQGSLSVLEFLDFIESLETKRLV